MNKITLDGTDGSTWTYHAVCGPQFSVPETGWVLTMKGPNAVAPQALTAGEVLGDLKAMMPDVQSSVGGVMAFTREMVESLDQQADEMESRNEDATETRNRARELERELAEGLAAIGVEQEASEEPS
jgi:hypothetical protein